MHTVKPVPSQYPAELIGYVEPWIADPGDVIKVKISCTEPEYTSHVIRLTRGHETTSSSPASSKGELLEAIAPQIRQGRFQIAHPGSYGLVRNLPFDRYQHDAIGVELSCYFQPFLPQSGHVQTIFSASDELGKVVFAIVLTTSGSVEVHVGSGSLRESIVTNFNATRKEWIEAYISMNTMNSSLSITLTPQARFAQRSTQEPFVLKAHQCGVPCELFKATLLTFGASYLDKMANEFFNGRITGLKAAAVTEDGSRRTMVNFDFSVGMQSDFIFDKSDASIQGRLFNAPTRAVTDHEWDGTEPDWTKAENGYDAIHFHEDDLEDAEWDTDIEFQIPKDARSGAYAVVAEATNGAVRDDIVFFVRPTAQTTTKLGARMAIVLPTFTYLAYGNERMYDQSKPSRMLAPNEHFTIYPGAHFDRMERRLDLGLSTYDVHKDESGVVHSSPRRPLLAVRPDYIHWAMGRPREFCADLMMISFLEHLGVPYDVITDHDMHLQGQSRELIKIDQYRVLITGSHPEYSTVESLDAYTEFSKNGGSIMYLGGNGFYWVAAMREEQQQQNSKTDDRQSRSSLFQARLEVRRGDQGVRSHTMPGGELHFSANGRLGALWRSRGRSPNVLFCIGSTGEGTGPGVPYARTEASHLPIYSWVFANTNKSSSIFGIEGYGGGASGDEIDKYDVRNGSPADAVVLATSTGHSDDFGIFPEELGFPVKDTCGTQTREIRSDVVYYCNGSGGQVFSVGSINWFCSLAWNGFDNDIARITANVIHRFLENTD